MKGNVEVLVVYTNPENWRLINEAKIAVQKNSAPDAIYLAFLRIDLKGQYRSAITHVARVDYTQSDIPLTVICEGRPDLLDFYHKKHYDLNSTHKYYYIDKKLGIVKLFRKIHSLPGDPSKGQVYFFTTFSELLRAKNIGEMKTLYQLSLD